LFSIHGFLRGTVAQVFVVLGLVAGLWAGLWVSHWLDEYWRGAQPYLAFLVLRWVVAALVGLGAAALFQWWGDGLGTAVRSGPAAWLDRGSGVGVGALVGIATSALVLMASLLVRDPQGFSDQVARARTAEPLMDTAARACSLSASYLPGGVWLTAHFRQAHRRTLEASAPSQRKKS
jgi:uncharacterized membrane protein required for colicin V production